MKAARRAIELMSRPVEGDLVQSGLCVLVAGMHRSGTSAITRILGHAGLSLPKNPLGSNEFNPTGHWEPIPLLRANERFMHRAGFDWDDLRRFALESLPAADVRMFVSEIAGLIAAEYGDSQVIVLKDPRLSVLLPLYERALTALNYKTATVLMVRSCNSVALSLNSRDGMLTEYGRVLWLRYMLEAEWNTRRQQRMLIRYESLVEGPSATIEELDGWLNQLGHRPAAGWSAEATASVRPDLQHHKNDDAVADLWTAAIDVAEAAFARLVKDGADAEAHAELDRMVASLDANSDDILGLVYAEMRQRQALASRDVSAK